ncbi:MAG: AAA family ATPase [Deltaproteobacteria bacterium]|nr:AAA family ATPase [Deltaproteobacteria bacterium]
MRLITVLSRGSGYPPAVSRAPAGFVKNIGKPVIIDEVQRVPDLLLAIKEDIDRNRVPGRYLLTGSGNVLTLPRVADALAGRMEVITLWPLSQGEIAGKKEDFIARAFQGHLTEPTRPGLMTHRSCPFRPLPP